MQDEHADVCSCGCQRPRLRLVVNNPPNFCDEIRKAYGLPSTSDDALDAALKDLDGVEARLAPFRTDALQNGG